MGQPDVRVLRENDLDAVMLLFAQLQPDDPPVAREKLTSTWRQILATSLLVHLGVFVDGDLVSTCHAAIVPNLTRGARPYAVIENVVTDQAWRRKGLGELAMRSLIARCWEAGCYKIMLSSAAKRGPAHAFYERLGFESDAKRAFVLKAPS